MNLSERFIKHLEEDKITEFTTQEALNWYNDQKTPRSKPANHADLSALIIRPLILQKKIRRVYIGSYLTTNRSASLPNEPNTPVELIETEMSEEDKEFFDYLNSKLKNAKP